MLPLAQLHCPKLRFRVHLQFESHFSTSWSNAGKGVYYGRHTVRCAYKQTAGMFIPQSFGWGGSRNVKVRRVVLGRSSLQLGTYCPSRMGPRRAEVVRGTMLKFSDDKSRVFQDTSVRLAIHHQGYPSTSPREPPMSMHALYECMRDADFSESAGWWGSSKSSWQNPTSEKGGVDLVRSFPLHSDIRIRSKEFWSWKARYHARRLPLV